MCITHARFEVLLSTCHVSWIFILVCQVKSLVLERLQKVRLSVGKYASFLETASLGAFRRHV
jgi:hypothetical protein